MNDPIVRPRHRIIYSVLVPFFKAAMRIKYGYRTIPFTPVEGPCVILANHLTTGDQFMVSCSFGRPVYFMASEHIFCGIWGKALEWLVAPIPKKKSMRDASAVHKCFQTVREGGALCIFPEGNRSYSGLPCAIDPSIAKLVKLCRCPLVLFHIHGGYGVDPRWGRKTRSGLCTGEVKEVIMPDEIRKMPVEELYEKIISTIASNEIPAGSLYKSPCRAEGLERVMYLCPKCGGVQTIETKGAAVRCTQCGLQAEYGEDLRLTSSDPDFPFTYVQDWYAFEEEYIRTRTLPDEDQPVYSDHTVSCVQKILYRSDKKICRGKFTGYTDRFEITDRASGRPVVYRFDDITSVTVINKHSLAFYIDDATYFLHGDVHFNALKYMQLFYRVRNNSNEEDAYLGI